MLRVLGVVFGLLLIAPGLCSLGLMGAIGYEYLRLPNSYRSQDLGYLVPLAVLWLVCFGLAAAGIALVRRSLSSRPLDAPDGHGDRYATQPRLIVRLLGWGILAVFAAGILTGILQGLMR